MYCSVQCHIHLYSSGVETCSGQWGFFHHLLVLSPCRTEVVMMVVEEGKKELLITLDEYNISGISRSFFYLILLKYNFPAKSLGGEFGVATTAGECRYL